MRGQSRVEFDLETGERHRALNCALVDILIQNLWECFPYIPAAERTFIVREFNKNQPGGRAALYRIISDFKLHVLDNRAGRRRFCRLRRANIVSWGVIY